MATNMFGWELTFRSVENDIAKKEDVLVVLIHWHLIKCGFKCIGIGDSKTLSGNETGTESLPTGWNANDTYALRYVESNRLFILKGTKSELDIVFNLLRVSDLQVSIIHFKVDETVKSLQGNIETLIPTYREVNDVIQKELLDPVVSGKLKEATTQTAQQQQQSRSSLHRDPSRPISSDDYDDPLRIGQPRRGIGVGFDPNWDPNTDPLAVGRSDLDPFGRGGGMIFNPFGPNRGGISDPGSGIPGGLPRGSVPPGARFDPFGPPGADIGRGRRGPGPNPDHLPPPGFDDMFM